MKIVTQLVISVIDNSNKLIGIVVDDEGTFLFSDVPYRHWELEEEHIVIDIAQKIRKEYPYLQVDIMQTDEEGFRLHRLPPSTIQELLTNGFTPKKWEE